MRMQRGGGTILPTLEMRTSAAKRGRWLAVVTCISRKPSVFDVLMTISVSKLMPPSNVLAGPLICVISLPGIHLRKEGRFTDGTTEPEM